MSYNDRPAGAPKVKKFGWSGKKKFSSNSHGFNPNKRRFSNKPRNRFHRSELPGTNYAKYIAKPTTVETFESEYNYEDFPLNRLLLNNILKKGYLKPTEIQEKTIPLILDGHDLVGISSTGSGKTAAFLIPIINKILHDHTQKLIVMAPTRELAMQIQKEADSLIMGTSLRTVRIIGGESMGKQIQILKSNPAIVIGTPGRLKDMYDRRFLHLAKYNNLVLDEVDKMLDMGFVDEIKYLLSLLPEPRHSLFFSATIDKRVEGITQSFLGEYQSVKIAENKTAHNVTQDIIKVGSFEDKVEKLHDLLIKDGVHKTLIFTETKRSVDKLEKQLRERGFKASGIHGDKSQFKRTKIINYYRANNFKILIATNVAARGIDIPDITHVINFDEPQNYDEYIHRIGRTGRNGKTGTAITFVY